MCTRPVFADSQFEASRAVRLLQQLAEDFNFKGLFFTHTVELWNKLLPTWALFKFLKVVILEENIADVSNVKLFCAYYFVDKSRVEIILGHL